MGHACCEAMRRPILSHRKLLRFRREENPWCILANAGYFRVKASFLAGLSRPKAVSILANFRRESIVSACKQKPRKRSRTVPFFGLSALVALSIAMNAPTAAEAQASYRQYCHERAQRLSGYRGSGDFVGGAARGAVGGAIMGSIFGSTKKDRRRGAAIGAIIGGTRSANRPNNQSARIYQLEYDDCMRRR